MQAQAVTAAALATTTAAAGRQTASTMVGSRIATAGMAPSAALQAGAWTAAGPAAAAAAAAAAATTMHMAAAATAASTVFRTGMPAKAAAEQVQAAATRLCTGSAVLPGGRTGGETRQY
jgi:hypothetical protein